MPSGLDEHPTPAPISGFPDDPSESTLSSERFHLVRQDVRDLKAFVGQEVRDLKAEMFGRMDRYESGNRDLLEQLRISNERADVQIGFLKRKEEREIAALESSKEAKLKHLEHEQRLQAERWRWFSTDFAKNALWPIIMAIVGAISAAAGYFFRGGESP